MAMRRRTALHEGEIVAIGPDMKGRPMQMVAAEDWEGIVIFMR